MTVYMFPGQGSQFRGMGAELFDEFRDMTEEASDLLGYNVATLCREDPERRLNNTRFTQPAIFVVNALYHRKRLAESQSPPTACIGHSLGEFNALHAAGAITFSDALALVRRRGELMSEAPSGAMAAILGQDSTAIQRTLEENDLSAIDIANYNAPQQTVISGRKEDIQRAGAPFSALGAYFVPLNTGGAFHSRYMAPAQAAFQPYVHGFKFSDLRTPVISNVYGEPYRGDAIAETLVQQITSPVRWSQSLRYLFERGERDFEELGPGDVLTKLLAKNLEAYEAPPRPSVHSASSTAGAPQAEPAAAAFNDDALRELAASNLRAARAKVEQWNKSYGIGTRVSVEGYPGALETRTEAMILLGHRPAVYLKDYKGYFALDDVIPA